MDYCNARDRHTMLFRYDEKSGCVNCSNRRRVLIWIVFPNFVCVWFLILVFYLDRSECVTYENYERSTKNQLNSYNTLFFLNHWIINDYNYLTTIKNRICLDFENQVSDIPSKTIKKVPVFFFFIFYIMFVLTLLLSIYFPKLHLVIHNIH